MRTGRWLVLGGSIVLLISAVLHANGYRGVAATIQANIANFSLANALKAVWLVMFVDQVILSVIVVVASRMAGGKRIILVAAMIPLADTLLLFCFLRIFIGTVLTGLATLLLVAGGLLLPTPNHP